MDATVSGVGVVDKAVSLLAPSSAAPARWPSWSTPPGCPGPPPTAWPSRSRPTGCCGATARGASCRAASGGAGPGRRRGAAPGGGGPPALERLRDDTGESVQLYVRDGDRRVCVGSLESPHGLRTIVAVGAVLELDRGSAGAVLRDERACGAGVESVGRRAGGRAWRR